MKNGDKVFRTENDPDRNLKKGDKGIIRDIDSLLVYWPEQDLNDEMQPDEFKKIPFEENYTLGDRVVRTKAMQSSSLVRPGEKGIIKETTRARYLQSSGQ